MAKQDDQRWRLQDDQRWRLIEDTQSIRYIPPGTVAPFEVLPTGGYGPQIGDPTDSIGIGGPWPGIQVPDPLGDQERLRRTLEAMQQMGQFGPMQVTPVETDPMLKEMVEVLRKQLEEAEDKNKKLEKKNKELHARCAEHAESERELQKTLLEQAKTINKLIEKS